jgi:hypothetical protein
LRLFCPRLGRLSFTADGKEDTCIPKAYAADSE